MCHKSPRGSGRTRIYAVCSLPERSCPSVVRRSQASFQWHRRRAIISGSSTTIGRRSHGNLHKAVGMPILPPLRGSRPQLFPDSGGHKRSRVGPRVSSP
ncbi:hypothetical protein PYCCODRAFT_1434737 [Trametes coccinea BRFM310]|uniref:Uncharacterized protein n=1 Tax=Trametes coccinea (strain BRFM310) TaxID=1353009 RepID=A0A1Y2IQB9_TRAC3|nr:hypothetical protein PYCCODRAFT_1434737 [Trametes coccinea BRFM310]